MVSASVRAFSWINPLMRYPDAPETEEAKEEAIETIQ